MIKGFIVSDHADRAPAFLQEVAPLVMSGRIKFREDIVDGLEDAPSAFIGLLRGTQLRQAAGARIAGSDARLKRARRSTISDPNVLARRQDGRPNVTLCGSNGYDHGARNVRERASWTRS